MSSGYGGEGYGNYGGGYGSGGYGAGGQGGGGQSSQGGYGSSDRGGYGGGDRGERGDRGGDRGERGGDRGGDRGGRRGGGRGHHGGGHGGGRHERRGIPLSELPADLTESSRKVIGAAIEVHKALGPGFDAQTYRNALRSELDAQQLAYQVGQLLPVKYKEREVGQVASDLFVENKFIVEIIARPGEVGTVERLALRGQLKAANVDLGLIINFAERRLKDGLVRVLNVEKLNAERGLGLGEGDEGGSVEEGVGH